MAVGHANGGLGWNLLGVKRALEGGLYRKHASGIVTAVLDRLYAAADPLIGVNERIEQMPQFVHEFRIAFHATYAAPPHQVLT